MAREIVGGNLNTWGDTGQFEADRSSWGFGDPPPGGTGWIVINRSFPGDPIYEGYGANCTSYDNGSTFPNVKLVSARFTQTAGKKYVAKVKALVPSGSPIASGARVIDHILPPLCSSVESITKTVTQALDTWVDVELYFLAYANFTNNIIYTRLTGAPTDLIGEGVILFDKYEIYEYVDVEDPEPECTLELDVPGTVVVDESGPGANDGSITVAITGGTGPFEYSKNGGSSWQSSNLFSGLASGSYNIVVRETGQISCNDSGVFSVNSDTPDFDFTLTPTHETIGGASDGQISVTPTGTGAPFQYSKNGGSTWQLSNLFTGLPPGLYYITVRNDADTQQVTKSVTINAGALLIEKTWHSKNPIYLQREAAAGWELLTNFRLFNEVRVEDIAESGVYNSKMKVELTPDADGSAIFYLQEAFSDCFSLVPPVQNASTIERLTDRIKRFKNFYGSMEEQEVEPASLTEGLPNLVVWGGISKEKFPGLNYFTTFLSAQKKFLTWAPIEKYVDSLQEDYLTFFVYGSYTSLKLQVKAYYDDSTNETSVTKTKTDTTRFQLYRIPAGPANCGVSGINPAKNLIRYELTLLDQADAVISETRIYHIAIAHPNTKYFLFVNSLGGDEVLRFTGQASIKHNFNRGILQRFLPYNYEAIEGEFTTHAVSSTRQTNFSSGYISNKLAKQWHEYLHDFLLSPSVYNVTDGTRIPVVVTAQEFEIMDQNYDRFIRFDARDAFDNESFTPSDI